MTITEFLLARIAEEEVVAQASIVTRGDVPRLAYEWRDPSVRADPVHVLAECEAKRRIVKRCDLVLHTTAIGCAPEFDDAPPLAQDTLVALASIYADHPDYDPEWDPRA